MDTTTPYTWTDPKRYLWLLGIIPATGLLLSLPIAATGHHNDLPAVATLSWYLLPFLVFILIPIADVLLGTDGRNPAENIIEKLEADPYYRWCTYLYIPFQYISLVLACYLWTADSIPWLGAQDGLSIIEKLGIAWTVGITSGIGINTAHELGHKIANSEKWLSRITLASSCYGHFFIEHNRGHHARVATPEDPASSRYGESFWRFLPRTVVGSVKSAWELESERLRRMGKSPWSIHNENIVSWLMSVVLFAVLVAVFGWAVLPWLIVQAVYGFCLLEAVNYLEHYGLLRAKVESGRYQRCRAEHSWNSDHLVTNIFLYHLQRHSDHHANPMRRYQVLRTVDDAPQLPAGYATMIMVAYVPPLWRRVMDPLLLAHYGGDVSKVNRGVVSDSQVALSRVVTDSSGVDGGVGSVYVCPHCGYRYDVSVGDRGEGFAAGMLWRDVPSTWNCPDCAVRGKEDFVRVV